jgi:rhodanese-related sulfurtransferase
LPPHGAPTDLVRSPPPNPPTSDPVKSYHDLVAEARARVPEVTASETKRLLQAHPDIIVIDCREPNETALGTVAGAVVIPRGVLEQNIERVATRDHKVILVCATGNRSLLAGDSLQEMGFTDVASMAGGFRAWVEAGGDIDG